MGKTKEKGENERLNTKVEFKKRKKKNNENKQRWNTRTSRA